MGFLLCKQTTIRNVSQVWKPKCVERLVTTLLSYLQVIGARQHLSLAVELGCFIGM